MLDAVFSQHSRWTARRIHRALFGQSLIDFTGTSWTNLSDHKTTTCTKISNRCKHKSHTHQTHILANFTNQFTSEDKDRLSSSDMDISPCDSACNSFPDSGSESRPVDFSQPPFKRSPEAFLVESEDHVETPLISAIANSGTEYFDLSPR